MRKSTLLNSLALAICLSMTVSLESCKKENQGTGEEVFNETYYINPKDSQIYGLESDRGRQIIYGGIKDSVGMPVRLTQITVDGDDLAPESRMLILLDEQGRITSMSSQRDGILEMNYVNDTAWVISVTLPDSTDTYQITFNPTKPVEGETKCGCPGTGGKTVPVPIRSTTVNYSGIQAPADFHKPLPLAGYVSTMYVPGNYGVPGLLVRGDWRLPNGKSGALPLNRLDDDLGFSFTLPADPAPPVPPEMLDQIKKWLKISAGMICGPSTMMTVGLISGVSTFCARFIVPPAIAKCVAFLTAYRLMCLANLGNNLGGLTYDFYTTAEVFMIFTALHPAYEPKYKSTTWNSTIPILPSVSITYHPYAAFTALYTYPANPAWKQGYMIVAKIVNAGSPPVTVHIKVVGECGYVVEKTFLNVLPGGVCNLQVPPGAIGRWDQITAGIITNDPPEDGQYRTLRVIF